MKLLASLESLPVFLMVAIILISHNMFQKWSGAVLPLCTATEILCRRHSRLRGSPVALLRHLLRSLENSTAAYPNTIEVSTTKGTK